MAGCESGDGVDEGVDGGAVFWDVEERECFDMPDDGFRHITHNLWRMLAISQATAINMTKLGGNLEISGTTVRHYNM